MSCLLSCLAYVKMYLHSCLFPRCSVNGLLLSSSSAGGAVCVTDCVPLLHSHLPLAPITQLALTQVKEDLRVQEGDQKGRREPGCRRWPNRLVELLQALVSRVPLPVLSPVDFCRLGTDCCPFLSRIMLRQWEETRDIASQLLESGDHGLLVDFDGHLDDITKDWTNQTLNAKIAELSSPANGSI
uniref:ER membrane protein complex subunit 9 n=1 Tax=Fundulus heteroclitus TaxID=8078 RepID=A0A3Q2NVX7_FUNHE